MKEKQLNGYGNRIRPLILLSSWLVLTAFASQLCAQTLSVRGKVTSSRIPVQNAAVTFVDNPDTTQRYSTLTDARGDYQIDVPTSIASNTSNLPVEFELDQSYPNPFFSSTAIPYQLEKDSHVQVTIYDVLGREVKKFVVGIQHAGSHNILWDGRDNFGSRVANGIYFYKLQTENESRIRKMILNAGGKGSRSFPQTFPARLPKASRVRGQSSQAETYTVLIENTENTLPLIVSQQVENVSVQNDTTINFTVTYIASAVADLDIVHQVIRGFGAANILQWRPDMTDAEIETAFGTGDGRLGFTMLRLRVPPESSQWSVNVSTAKKAHEMGAIVFASPWSPPAAMKTNSNLIGGELQESAYADYAAHLNGFADFMSDNGVPLYAISLQNEPDIQVSYESCDWSPQQMVKFLRENAASIGTRVIAPESFQFRRAMSDPILNDSLASANLDILGGHIYGGGLASYPLAEKKGKEIWMTEHLSGENSHANDWSWAMSVATEINDVMQAGMSAYIWWYIVRFYGPISDGERENSRGGRKGEVTKKGYVMSQFSQFIRPGYHRVDVASWPPVGNLSVTAYKDSSSSKVVIVAINDGTASSDLVVQIKNVSASMFTPYTTSEFKNVVQGDNVSVIDSKLNITMEASSITTFVSE